MQGKTINETPVGEIDRIAKEGGYRWSNNGKTLTFSMSRSQSEEPQFSATIDGLLNQGFEKRKQSKINGFNAGLKRKLFVLKKDEGTVRVDYIVRFNKPSPNDGATYYANKSSDMVSEELTLTISKDLPGFEQYLTMF